MDDPTRETWLPVVGWEGLYEVSVLGRVRSLPRKWVPAMRMLTLSLNAQGYYKVALSRPGNKRRNRPVHILVAAAFLGPVPDGMEIRHLDGARTNPALGNLRYGTPGENTLDSIRHGTHNMARKTHCPQDHEYTRDNTYIEPSGRRSCRACNRIKAQAYKARNRDLVKARMRAYYYRTKLAQA